MKNIFLSDLHIGVDAITNLYKSKEHQASLKGILKYIQENGSKIRDVVILGDWIDLWMYTSTSVPMAKMPEKNSEGYRNGFLPTVKQIIEANPSIFQRQKKDLGDFVSCMDSIQGKFYYVNGNHDITVTGEELNSHFKPLSEKGREIYWIDCFKDPIGYKSAIGDIYGAHGHWYSMVCRPYKPELLPLGYYITRVGMDAQLKMTEPLPPLNVDQIKLVMKENNYTFAKAILSIIANQAETTLADLNFTLPDGHKISASAAADKYPLLSVDDCDFKTADVEGILDDNAANLFTESKTRKVVVLGHTHISKMVQDFRSETLYANSGFLCAGKPNEDTDLPISTFVEIEDTDDNVIGNSKLLYTVNMFKVDFATSTVITNPPVCTRNVYNFVNLALYKPADALT
jgi:predicted phosphodiesterase